MNVLKVHKSQIVVALILTNMYIASLWEFFSFTLTGPYPQVDKFS